MYPDIPEAELAFHDKLTLCWTGVVPVPARVSVTGLFVALLRNESDADAVPEDWGRNVTLKGMLWPLANVRGKVRPLSANSALVLEADEIVTAAPLAASVPDITTLVPVVMLPKL